MALVKMKDLLLRAQKENKGCGAFSVGNMEMVKGAIKAAEELDTPIILQIAEVRLEHSPLHLMGPMMLEAARNAKVDVAVHLDHGLKFETIKKALEYGFTSVMLDASRDSFEENIEKTKEVVEYAHAHGVVVEAELGQLAGIEDDVKVAAHEAHYTDPNEVEEFVKETGVDSLAIAIGTSHGAYKFTPDQCTRNEQGILVPPPLRFDILEEVAKRLPNFPIVLHGASSVPQDFVKIINENGGHMPDAVGVPEDQLRKAASMAVCKINIDSDLRLAMTAGIRKHFNDHPDHFDPRQYVADGRTNIKAIVSHKIKEVLGCDGKA